METKETQVATFIKYVGTKLSFYILELTTFLVTFFSPAGYILAAVGFAILVDTYFGRWRARKAPKEGEIVSSKITRIGVVNKSIGYMLVVAGSFLMDKAFMNEIIGTFFNLEYTVTKGVGLVFCWIEYTSVNESYTAVKGKSLGQAVRELLKNIKIVREEIKDIKKDKK